MQEYSGPIAAMNPTAALVTSRRYQRMNFIKVRVAPMIAPRLIPASIRADILSPLERIAIGTIFSTDESPPRRVAQFESQRSTMFEGLASRKLVGESSVLSTGEAAFYRISHRCD